jgi:hypothetical protein
MREEETLLRSITTARGFYLDNIIVKHAAIAAVSRPFSLGDSTLAVSLKMLLMPA